MKTKQSETKHTCNLNGNIVNAMIQERINPKESIDEEATKYFEVKNSFTQLIFIGFY